MEQGTSRGVGVVGIDRAPRLTEGCPVVGWASQSTKTWIFSSQRDPQILWRPSWLDTIHICTGWGPHEGNCTAGQLLYTSTVCVHAYVCVCLTCSVCCEAVMAVTGLPLWSEIMARQIPDVVLLTATTPPAHPDSTRVPGQGGDGGE